MERDNPSTRSMSIESSEFNLERRPEEPQQPPSPNALKVAATECLNSWITYLQMLNSLSSAGVRLAQSLANLSQQQNLSMANNCLASWDELAKSTVIASHTVKTHIAAAMQDMSIGETFTEDDATRQQEHNQQIIAENLLTFINLQYQYSIAGCECFGALAMCPSCHTTAGGPHEPDCSIASLQQCFSRLYAQENRSQTSSPHFLGQDKGQIESPKGMGEFPRQNSPNNLEGRVPSPYQEGIVRGPSPIHGFMENVRGPLPNPGQLHTMKMPFLGRNPRSPLHFPLFPLSGQRRWSEAAAGDVSGESGDGTMRRWSMPWDCGRIEAPPWQQRYLPSKLAVPNSSQDRSRSTTPEGVPQPQTITSGEGLAEAIQLLSCRPMRCAIPHSVMPGHSFSASPWGESHEERMQRRMFHSQSQRGNWQSIDVPQSSGMSVTEHYDIFPPGMPLTSRKSSSSTDSSSCLSIHSRSTSSSERGSDGAGPPESMRMHTNIYSIWSGNEHLPFIRLPESQEPTEEGETEDSNSDFASNGSKPP